MTTTRRALGAAAALAAVLLAGCGGTPTRYYTLAEPTPATPAAARPANAPLAIDMAPIALAERLARPQMVVRKAGAPEAEVEVLEQSRWSSSFESELRDALGAGIAARLGALDTTKSGNGHGRPVYRIAVQLRQFDAVEGQRVDGAFGWTVRRADGEVQLGCQLALTEAAAGGGVAALAQGAQRITTRLADAIAGTVAALAGAQPARCPS